MTVRFVVTWRMNDAHTNGASLGICFMNNVVLCLDKGYKMSRINVMGIIFSLSWILFLYLIFYLLSPAVVACSFGRLMVIGWKNISMKIFQLIELHRYTTKTIRNNIIYFISWLCGMITGKIVSTSRVITFAIPEFVFGITTWTLVGRY